jgi:hypothetical protein
MGTARAGWRCPRYFGPGYVREGAGPNASVMRGSDRNNAQRPNVPRLLSRMSASVHTQKKYADRHLERPCANLTRRKLSHGVNRFTRRDGETVHFRIH